MKFLNKIPSWLKNKYLLSGTGFVIWMLFFDPRDIFTQFERTKELSGLKTSKAFYQKEIAKETTELEQLKNDPATLEKYAREKYLMKKDNEDLFIVPEKEKDLNK